MKLCECCGSASGWQHNTRLEIVQVSGSIRCARVFSIVTVSVISVTCRLLAISQLSARARQTMGAEIGARRRWRSFRWRGINHELKALLGRRELRNVVLRVGSSYMFLHRSISLFLRIQTLLPHLNRQKQGSLERFAVETAVPGHSRRGNVCDSWSHLDFAVDKPLRCWHPRQRKTKSTRIAAAW